MPIHSYFDPHSFRCCKHICSVLNEHGFEGYLVGGAVRDALLQRKSQDLDITTNAKPDQVESLFSHTIPTGKAFGTITVVLSCENHETAIEVTTYRSEGNYSNQRHPDSITFETELEKDLERRDFSINAIAYDPIKNTIIDPHHGQDDIKKKLLRVVGKPFTRFSEDSLRLFRLCRFVSQLDFDVVPEVLEDFLLVSKTAQLPAKERIHTELSKLMASNKPSTGLTLLQKSDLGDQVIPNLSSLSTEQFSHLDHSEANLRWATLLQPLELKPVFSSLCFSKKEKNWISKLIRYNCDPKKAAFDIKDLALSGSAIQEMGFYGVDIGLVQRFLHSEVLEDFSLNTEAALTSLVEKKWKKHLGASST